MYERRYSIPEKAKGMPRKNYAAYLESYLGELRNLGSPGKERGNSTDYLINLKCECYITQTFCEFINCEIVKSKSLSSSKSFKSQLLTQEMQNIYEKQKVFI